MKTLLIPYLKKYTWPFTTALIFGLLGIASGAMLLFVSGYLISKSALQVENVMLIYVPIVAVRAFSISKAVFPYLEKLTSHDLVLRILATMRTKLYHLVEPHAIFLHSRYKTGDLLAVLAEDIAHLQDLFIRTIIPGILGVVLYTLVIIIFGAFDWTFALLLGLLLGALVFLIPLFSLLQTKQRHVTQKTSRNRLYQQLTDAIFGMADWQASGRTTQLLADLQARDDHLQREQRLLQRFSHWRDAATQFIIGITIVAVMIWISIQTGSGVFSNTMIAAFTLMIFSITDALMPLSQAASELPSYTDSVKRLQQLADDNSVTQSQKSIDIRSEVTEKHVSTGDIQLTNVSFQYAAAQKRVLDHISLNIEAGRKIAVLGQSGTGKSTLLLLLAGMLEPTSGYINVGGIPMNSSLISKSVSILNQKPHLFDTTIENNIRIGKPDATDSQIAKVIKEAQLSNLIDSLPNGLQTNMHEMGNRFSGGQRQRIALARVLLQDTPILLVDEATNGLDPATETELINTMLTAANNKTIIWVTHHLAGVENMDEIIFLKNGSIHLQGSHDALFKHSSYYRKLYVMDRG
ncbi:thiol reductant ABC exporter subunit CydC [Virgibacillus halophilus]|uniref:thiol reductant ABC exporter subunit CydC n=1 Tax=Tigheibacillus halophilus TaxID=361280 RepID=UPI0036387985